MSAEADVIIGVTAQEVGAVDGAELAVGEVASACAVVASGSDCASEDVAPARLDLGDVWDEPLSESPSARPEMEVAASGFPPSSRYGV